MSTTSPTLRPCPLDWDTIDAVSIDFDGTLADLGSRRLGLWKLWLRHRSLLLAWREELETHRGRFVPDLRRSLGTGIARRAGVTEEYIQHTLFGALDHTWPRLYSPDMVPHGVQSFLRECHERGLPLAVVSDHPSVTRVARLGLEAVAVIDCQALGALKPLPDGLLTAAALLGCTPSRLLHVGDRDETDGAAAHAAGCRFLHVDQLLLTSEPG